MHHELPGRARQARVRVIGRVRIEHQQVELARNYIAYRRQRAMLRATRAYSFASALCFRPKGK